MGRVCRGFLQCLLKLLNFLLILVGIAMIVYSLWMLNEWNSRQPKPSSPPVPPPEAGPGPEPEPEPEPIPFPGDVALTHGLEENVVGFLHTGRATGMIDLEPTIEARMLRKKLPAPWFIYAFFGVGVIVLLMTCTGHIAAETASGCCLCCYTVCLVVLLLAQAALAGVLIFDKNWEKDIPEDPTGEFQKIEKFIKHNFDICRWVALGVVVIEALSLFLAILLRSIAVGAQKDYDSDEDYPPRTRQPLLNRQAPQGNPTTPAAPAESRPPRNDAWSTRMREKYGLDTSEFTYNPVDSKRVQQQNAPPAEETKRCVIM